MIPVSTGIIKSHAGGGPAVSVGEHATVLDLQVVSSSSMLGVEIT